MAGFFYGETAVTPSRATLRLMSRHDAPDSRVTAVSPEQVWTAIMQNSLYFDDTAVWQRNLAQLAKFMEGTAVYRVMIGVNEDGMVKALGGI